MVFAKRKKSENDYNSRGSSEENEFHICVRVCGVEGRGKVFPVSSSWFARKTTWRNRARSHSGA